MWYFNPRYVDRVSETQLHVGENSNWIIWQLKGAGLKCSVLFLQELIYQEFFSQGDMEKSLGRSPVEMMDRERAYIPELQISFLDNIALPVFK